MFRKAIPLLICATGVACFAPSFAPSADAATWLCTTSVDSGACGPYQDASITNSDGYNTYALNDVWNPAAAFKSQTLNVDSPSDWQATATAAAGNTAVLSYPDTQQIFTLGNDTAPLVSTFTTVVSDYTSALPSNPAPGSDYESAYDIWLHNPMYNSSAGSYFELMIWTHNHGQTPAGTNTGKTFTITQDGVSTTYDIWKASSGTPITLVQTTASDSQREHLLDILNWLGDNGYVSPPSQLGIWQVDYGFEICSTGGTAENFSLTRFDIGLGCAGGGSSCYGG
jgi:hypothetical protein